MRRTQLPRQLRSWWKQEALALTPAQRQRLLRVSAVLLLGLTQGLLEVILSVSPPLVSSPAASATP